MKPVVTLKKSKEFQMVYRIHHSKANRLFIMYLRKNKKNGLRLGISVSKKVGNSVVRHRVARVIREIFRLNQQEVNDDYDIVIVVRPGAKDADYHSYEEAIFHLLKLHHLLNE